MRRCIVFSCAALFFLAATATDAYAAGDSDQARVHFEAGKKLRDDGDCAHAIPEFDKSLAADKSIGAFYNLGFCHEQLGHKQDAHEAYKRAQQLASTKKDDRLREISGALASLLETSPHIRLVLPQQLPEGIQIRVDDQLVPESVYGTEMVVFTKLNAKSHTVVVTAPGWEERRETVDTKAVKAIELRKVGKDPKPGPVTPQRVEGSWTWQHWLGAGLAGGGLVVGVVALGLFLDYLPNHQNNELARTDALCNPAREPKPPPGACDSTTGERKHYEFLVKENNQLEKDIELRLWTLGIVGGALIASGMIVFILAPPSSSASAASTAASKTPSKGFGKDIHVAPLLGPTQQGFSIVGRF